MTAAKRPAKGKRDCACIEEVNALLVTRNSRLIRTVPLTDAPSRAILATEGIDRVRGKRAVTMSANYCPFCGKAYRVDDARPPTAHAIATRARRGER